MLKRFLSIKFRNIKVAPGNSTFYKKQNRLIFRNGFLISGFLLHYVIFIVFYHSETCI